MAQFLVMRVNKLVCFYFFTPPPPFFGHLPVYLLVFVRLHLIFPCECLSEWRNMRHHTSRSSSRSSPPVSPRHAVHVLRCGSVTCFISRTERTVLSQALEIDGKHLEALNRRATNWLLAGCFTEAAADIQKVCMCRIFTCLFVGIFPYLFLIFFLCLFFSSCFSVFPFFVFFQILFSLSSCFCFCFCFFSFLPRFSSFHFSVSAGFLVLVFSLYLCPFPPSFYFSHFSLFPFPLLFPPLSTVSCVICYISRNGYDGQK